MCALAGRLASQGTTFITILMAPNWLQSAHADIVAQFPAGDEALERIRCAQRLPTFLCVKLNIR